MRSRRATASCAASERADRGSRSFRPPRRRARRRSAEALALRFPSFRWRTEGGAIPTPPPGSVIRPWKRLPVRHPVFRCCGSPASLCEFAREFTIDQDEGNAAIAVAAIGPAVIGAALDYDVAGIDGGFSLIEDQYEFAFEHDPVIDRFGAMHMRMARTLAMRRCGGCAHLGEVPARLFGRHVFQP